MRFLPTTSAFVVFVLTLLPAVPAQAQLAAPNDAGVAFNHLHLNVTDTALHKRLWTELLGGEVAERAGFVAIRLPGTLVFLRDDEPTAPSRDTAVDHFGFRVRDLDATLTAWRAMGYDVDGVSSDADAPTAFLTLPDGATLELEEDTTLSVTAAMDHVHFVTPEHGGLPAWYANLFGAVPSDDTTAADVPGATLRFSEADVERAPTEYTAVDHIGFEVEDMDAFVRLLQGEGIELVFGPHYIEDLDLWVAFFFDPSGVLVEVSEGLDAY